MDYEKLHKDTIAKLQEMVNSGKITVKTACSICADFVPESEDERIRKELVAFLKETIKYGGISPDIWTMDNANKWLAWFEKQGKDNMGISEDTKKKLEDNLNKALEKETPESWNKFLDEQKSTELEENRSKELSLSLQIQAYLNTASDELYAKGKPLYSEERIEDIHKCMLMWQKLHNAYFYQKSVWSEDDERIRIETIELLETANHPNKMRSNGKPLDFTENINFLKSLKDRYTWKLSEQEKAALRTAIHIMTKERNFPKLGAQLQNILDAFEGNSRVDWKPSDEQMGVIEAVINNRSFQRRHLDSLYEQLKKLREE